MYDLYNFQKLMYSNLYWMWFIFYYNF